MRIISQDARVDLPYEAVGVSIKFSDSKEIIAYTVCGFSPDDNFWTMARYSDEAKAKIAMDMLQNVYYESELSKVCNDGTTFLTTHFRFPKDDEVEV